MRHPERSGRHADYTVYCTVSRIEVFRVTDLEDHTTRVICSDYDTIDRTCRLKTCSGGNGPLAQLLERAHEGSTAMHDVRCVVA